MSTAADHRGRNFSEVRPFRPDDTSAKFRQERNRLRLFSARRVKTLLYVYFTVEYGVSIGQPAALSQILHVDWMEFG